MNKLIKEVIESIDLLTKSELECLYLSYSRLTKKSEFIINYIENRLQGVVK